MNKHKVIGLAVVLVYILTMTTQFAFAEPAIAAPKPPKPRPTTINYGTVKLQGTSLDAFPESWDLTLCDLSLSATMDLRDMLDGDSANEHGWPEIGIRDSDASIFNPDGAVWLVGYSMYPASEDDANEPIFDRDDSLHLQTVENVSVNGYDLPVGLVNPDVDNSYRVWFDRDGIEPILEANPLFIDRKTHNTKGIYKLDMRFHATSAESGEAYLFVNDLAQGFESDGDPTTMEHTPAGLTFEGDLERMQVFYALIVGTGGSDNLVTFSKIKVKGCLNQSLSE